VTSLSPLNPSASITQTHKDFIQPPNTLKYLIQLTG
jgi:hypothetical protein